MNLRSNKNVKFYYGSALFSVTLDFAKYLVSQETRIFKLFRWSLAPDEKFIQTILMNSPFARNRYVGSSSNAYLIDWKRREGNSPRVWRNRDLQEISEQPRDICYARKFMSDIDLEIVDALKKSIIND